MEQRVLSKTLFGSNRSNKKQPISDQVYTLNYTLKYLQRFLNSIYEDYNISFGTRILPSVKHCKEINMLAGQSVFYKK